MKKITIAITILLQFSLNAQWNDNGNSMTTTDKIGIGLSPFGIFNVKGGTLATSYLNGVAVYNSNGTAIRSALSITEDDNGRINLYNSSTNLKVFINSFGDSFFNGGNVGIGTANPTSNFEVYKYDGSSHARIYTNQHNGTAKLEIAGGVASFGSSYSGWSLYHSHNHTAKDLYFRYGQSGNPNFVFTNEGALGIGTISPDAKLAVNGNIHTKEVKVDLIGWPDYVFGEEYNLPTLEEVETHIEENGHLQDIPSAEEVEENGIKLGEMNSKLLQKIEELMLYTIQQQKEIKAMEKQLENMQSYLKTNK